MQPRKIFGSPTSDTPDLEQMVSEAQAKAPSKRETQARTPSTRESQTEQSPGLDSFLGKMIGGGQSISGPTSDMPNLGSLASNQSVSNHLGSTLPPESDMPGTGTEAFSESIPDLAQALQEQTEAQSPGTAALEQLVPGSEQQEEAP